MEPIDLDLASTASDTTTYIISFKDKGQSPAKRCEALAKSNRGVVQYVYDQVLNGCSLMVPVGDAPAAFNAFKKNPTVSMVEEDQVMSIDDTNEVHIILDSTNRMLQVQVPSWGLDRINQCARPLDDQESKQDAGGVTVFIIDTGIYAAHDEFAGAIGVADVCHASFIAGGNALNDDNGHG
jgi:subtilisin family serine protease